jgi:hypothetical protein
VHQQPVEQYPIEQLDRAATTKPAPLRARFKPRKQGWTVAA